MATVHQVINGAFARPSRPLFEWRDYVMAVAVGVIFACVAALRLEIGPLEHAALDPVANRGFLFGIFEYLASHLGGLPTVAVVGVLMSLLTLQFTALSQRQSA